MPAPSMRHRLVLQWLACSVCTSHVGGSSHSHHVYICCDVDVCTSVLGVFQSIEGDVDANCKCSTHLSSDASLQPANNELGCNATRHISAISKDQQRCTCKSLVFQQFVYHLTCV